MSTPTRLTGKRGLMGGQRRELQSSPNKRGKLSTAADREDNGKHSMDVNDDIASNDTSGVYDFRSSMSSIGNTESFYKKKPLAISTLRKLRAARESINKTEIQRPLRALAVNSNNNDRKDDDLENKAPQRKSVRKLPAAANRRAAPIKKANVKKSNNRFEVVVTLAVAAPEVGRLPDANRKFFKHSGSVRMTTTMVGRHRLTSSSAAAIKREEKHARGDVGAAAREIDVQVPFLSLMEGEESPKTPEETSESSVTTVPPPNENTSPIVSEESTPSKPKPQWPIKYNSKSLSQNGQEAKSGPAKRKPKKSSAQRTSSKSGDGKDKEQMIIDAGQRNIGPIVCKQCGMFYAHNNPEDVAVHMKMHNATMNSLKFMGWKNETVLQTFDDGRILLVTADDPKYAQKKVDDVLEVVNQSLGFNQSNQPDRQNLKVYLFVSTEKKIVGCAMAEPIKKAFRLIVNDADDQQQNGPLCCSTEPEPATCGINRIWTAASHRRRRIASRLIDCVLHTFYYGSVLSADKVAFSDPTPNGRCLAANYFHSPRFLVYN